MQTSTADQKRTAVRQADGAIATERQSGCGGDAGCGCGGDASRQLGYTDQDLTSVPEGANLGIGCGNPQAVAALKPGERVLNLGWTRAAACSSTISAPSSPTSA